LEALLGDERLKSMLVLLGLVDRHVEPHRGSGYGAHDPLRPEPGRLAPPRRGIRTSSSAPDAELARLRALDVATSLRVDRELCGEGLLGRLPFSRGASLRSRISA
jgi:hypothetical protein